MSDNPWHFPLLSPAGLNYHHPLPLDAASHPGAFGAVRKFDVHTGVDLYCEQGTPVFAVEDGTVVEIEIFTGPRAESPWWHETYAILVEGASGVVCYGEVEFERLLRSRLAEVRKSGKLEIRDILNRRFLGVQQQGEPFIKVGQTIRRGEVVSWTKQVLKKDKGKPMCMLHFELYTAGTRESVWWKRGQDKPENLLDPTKLLQEALNNG